MKAFIAFFALVAAVAAEADPVILAAGTYAAAPIVAAATPFTYNYNGAILKSAPCVNVANAPVPCADYPYIAYAPTSAYLGYSLGAGLWKREAEAEADAEPAIFYNALGAPAWAGAYTTTALIARGLKAAPCVNNRNMPVACAAGYSYYAPLTTAVAAPAVVTKTIAAPAVVNTAAVIPSVRTVVSHSAPVVTSSVYSAGPLISSLAAPASTIKLAKREADSEADPAYFYSGLPAWNAYSAINGAYGYPYALASPYNAGAGLVHTSRLGLCLNYVGQQVPC